MLTLTLTFTDMGMTMASPQLRRLCQWSSGRNFAVLTENVQQRISLVAYIGSMNVTELGVAQHSVAHTSDTHLTANGYMGLGLRATVTVGAETKCQ